MKPAVNTLSAETIERILARAKAILAEIGIEVRGPALRRQLRSAGLREAGDGRLRLPGDREGNRRGAEDVHPLRSGRLHAEVERRLVAYEPPVLDLDVADEMRHLLRRRAGKGPLPPIPSRQPARAARKGRERRERKYGR